MLTTETKPENKTKLFSIFAMLLVAGILVYAFFIHDNKKPVRYLAIFGPQQYESKNGKTDTTYHMVQDFHFTDQDGKAISQKDLEGSIYVTDFFFTTCHSICPIMSNQMERIYMKFRGNPEVKFLSHTVDPEIDTVQQLKAYAIKHNADSKQWMFVTGGKKELYDVARTGYFLDAQQGDGGPDDFIHTQNFALIDKDKRIRGYYDGTDSTDVDQLMKDIELLLMEYHYKEGK
ncbi:MAG: photosynthetic protein synthase [Bacteroidetes bacterium]|nr:photosynthetic protein synthase [Bacteroidota bacterium]